MPRRTRCGGNLKQKGAHVAPFCFSIEKIGPGAADYKGNIQIEFRKIVSIHFQIMSGYAELYIH